MYQNIKVDIIYFKTPTDFEMEFNLSGCCRMRLLTDKAPDRKTLVNHLVRAVSRSRIIMIAGALFGDDGIITTCSKAIGKPLTEINNSQYGISGEEGIEIINDSIPLVSSNGIFGGCIIEQGPQTLILLSENKDVRKNIMQNLIHSYVKEICADELSEKSNTAVVTSPEEPPQEDAVEEITSEESATDNEEASNLEDEPSETETEPENSESENENILENAEDNGENIQLNSFAENAAAIDDVQIDTALAEDSQKEIFSPESSSAKDLDSVSDSKLLFAEDTFEDDKVPDRFDEDFYNSDLNDDDEEKIFKRKKADLNIPIIIISIILIFAVALICYCIFFSPDVDGKTIGGYLKETFDTLFG